MALVWRPGQLKLEVFCIRKGEVERVLDVTAHGLETVRKNLEAGRLTSSIRAFLDNGGEQLQLVTTRRDKVISWLETYTYRYATTDDGNEDEPPQKMPRTGPFEPVEFDPHDFDLGPPPQFPPGTPSGIISQYTERTASQMKKKRVVIGVELELELEVDAARRRRVPGLVPSRYDRARVFIAKSREHRRPARPWGLCAALWRRPGSTQWPLGPRRVRH